MRRVTTAEHTADIYAKLLPTHTIQKRLRTNGLQAHADGEGGNSMLINNKDNNTNPQQRQEEVVQKSVKHYKKHNEELEQQVQEP